MLAHRGRRGAVGRNAVSRTIRNEFFNGAVLPWAVITLNSPSMGAYEAHILRRLFLDDGQGSGTTDRRGTPRRRPWLLCADGSFHRTMSHVPELRKVVDYVVGDFDSLVDRNVVPDSCVTLVRHFSPFSRSQLDHWRRQRLTSSTFDRPYLLKVLDQDSNDFAKCLTLCEQILLMEKRNESGTPTQGGNESSRGAGASQRDELQQAQFLQQCLSNFAEPVEVLVLGSQGGEWQHEIAALHAAGKYAGTALDVRLHTPQSTVSFCLPNGVTRVERNSAFETTAASIVPLGVPPRAISTTGLKWNVALPEPGSNSPGSNDARSGVAASPSSSSVPLFGFSAAANAFISTSNYIVDPNGTVEVSCSSAEGHPAVVALSINHNSFVSVSEKAAPLGADSVRHPRVGVCILVVRRDPVTRMPMVLMIRRGKQPNKGLWAFPGGSVERGETTVEAAARELREETNLTTEPSFLRIYPRPLSVIDLLPSTTEEGGDTHFVLVVHIAEVRPSRTDDRRLAACRPSSDADALEWWSLEKIKDAEVTGCCVPHLVKAVEQYEKLIRHGVVDAALGELPRGKL